MGTGCVLGQAHIDPNLPAGSQPLAKQRVLLLFPDYETVNPGTLPNAPAPVVAPLSVKQKFQLFAGQIFDPSVVVISGALAGIQQAGNLAPSYGQGGDAYAQRFGAMSASITSGSLLSQAVMPTVFHQDPRYFKRGNGPAIKRVGYAMSRVFVTQSDRGTSTFNYSQVTAFAGSTALANTYDPEVNRTASQNATRFAIGLAISAGLNVLREFQPSR